MKRPSRYKATCAECSAIVAPGAGVLEKRDQWVTLCALCSGNANTVAAMVNNHLKKWRGGSIYPYQWSGIGWLSGRQRAMLCDDQGLGKTLQVLASIPRGAAVVLICPAVAKGSWGDHIEALRPDLSAVVGFGRGFWLKPRPNQVTIMNYEIMPDLVDGHFAGDLPDSPIHVIADEAHFLKSLKAGRTLKFRALAREAYKRGGSCWLLTGTPIKTDPPDLWTLLNILGLQAETFGSWRCFRRMLGGRAGPFSSTIWDRGIDKEVPDILRRVMLRRVKGDVLPDLPPKRHDTINVEISDEAARACDAAIEALRAAGLDLEMLTMDALEGVSGVPFEEMSAACKALAAAKIPAILDLLDLEETTATKPLIVWSRHTAPLIAVAARPGWEKIDGTTTHRDRERFVKAFQTGELRGLACSIAAAGTAITLTACDHALFVDKSWSYADNVQAEDRIHRIGQDADSCRYTMLVARHRLDERLAELLHRRGHTFDAAINAARTVE